MFTLKLLLECEGKKNKTSLLGWVRWFMPLIPATQEAERGESQFEASPGKKLVRPYLKNNRDLGTGVSLL
jgi:hypothetical protein